MFEIERYRTVWQMTSTITAELRERITLVDLFAALFPSGSVTGAPKIAATRFIASLESSPREVYCGAIGFVRPGGDCTFNVPIRTLRIDRAGGTAVYGVGAGITWDSAADAEYDESLGKADLLCRPWPRFEIIETMRSDDGRIPRLERHLARMRESAEYFGFGFDLEFDADGARRALIAAASEHAGARRLRLRLARDGTFAIDSTADEPPAAPVPVAFATRPVNANDPFLHHKTTARGVCEERLAERPDAWDVLLVNENGEVTEFTRGNVVIESGGRHWTPPREAGLLAGTFRAELLEAGRIAERTIRPADVQRADRVWLINSVRGRLPVRLLDQEPPRRGS
jgi:para-aminobenzoate synthetase/4-amino-4-deoxychorismate lyase